jgi:hypothetical protein
VTLVHCLFPNCFSCRPRVCDKIRDHFTISIQRILRNVQSRKVKFSYFPLIWRNTTVVRDKVGFGTDVGVYRASDGVLATRIWRPDFLVFSDISRIYTPNWCQITSSRFRGIHHELLLPLLAGNVAGSMQRIATLAAWGPRHIQASLINATSGHQTNIISMLGLQVD